MTRLIVILGLCAAAFFVLDGNGTVRISSGGGSTGAISGYTGASAPAIKGIANAAG